MELDMLAPDSLSLADSILSVAGELVLKFGIFEPFGVDFDEVLKVAVVHRPVVTGLHYQKDFQMEAVL